MKQRFFSLALLLVAAFVGTACSDDDNSSDKTYKIGDFYDVGGVQGVVFKVTDEGRHGLIVSLDENSAVDWATEAAAMEVTGATNDSDGAVNMIAIEAISGWQTKFPVFAWCATKNTGSVTGWYLPAFYELADIFEAYEMDKESFNKSLTDNRGTAFILTENNDVYWSSSENLVSGRQNQAAFFGFFDKTFGFREKARLARARAIHVF